MSIDHWVCMGPHASTTRCPHPPYPHPLYERPQDCTPTPIPPHLPTVTPTPTPTRPIGDHFTTPHYPNWGKLDIKRDTFLTPDTEQVGRATLGMSGNAPSSPLPTSRTGVPSAKASVHLADIRTKITHTHKRAHTRTQGS